jgi:DNA-binding NarL/FixJ family response regulator
MDRKIKIILADQLEMFRRSLRELLAGYPGLEVVAEAQDGREAIQLSQELEPDLVLLDVQILDFNGLEAARQIRALCPQIKVLALAMHTDKRFVKKTMDAGVAGYLLKDCAHEELVQAVHQVMEGETYLSPAITLTERFLQDKDSTKLDKQSPLTKFSTLKKEVRMPYNKKVKDLMIPLEDYPHIPYWFTLRQAMAIVREAAIKFEGSFEPRAVLVFDEKYQLMGMLTLRDIIRGLEPKFAQDRGIIKADPNLAVLMGDMFGPNMREQSQKPVSEVMSPIKITVNGEDPITKALFLMISENVGMMPVLLVKKVVGMVRMSDLFKEISDVVLGD